MLAAAAVSSDPEAGSLRPPFGPTRSALLCNNLQEQFRGAKIKVLSARVSQAKRILLWLVLGTLAALLSYFAFRGYFSPDFLIGFSNVFRC